MYCRSTVFSPDCAVNSLPVPYMGRPHSPAHALLSCHQLCVKPYYYYYFIVRIVGSVDSENFIKAYGYHGSDLCHSHVALSESFAIY